MHGSIAAVTSLSQHTQHSSSYQPLLLAFVRACWSGLLPPPAAAVDGEGTSLSSAAVLKLTDLPSLRAGELQVALANADVLLASPADAAASGPAHSGLVALLLAGVVVSDGPACTTIRSTSALLLGDT